MVAEKSKKKGNLSGHALSDPDALGLSFRDRLSSHEPFSAERDTTVSDRGHLDKKILMVFPTVPYPLRESGISIRYLPIIQHLSQKHRVDLVIISDMATDAAKVEELKKNCHRVFVIENPKYARHGFLQRLTTQGLFLLPWGPPNSYIVYGGSEIFRQIADLASATHYDTLVWVSGHYTPYLRSCFADRIVVDLIDSPSLIMKRRVAGALQNPLLQQYEFWKMKRWEARLIRTVDACIYISSFDAETIPAAETPDCERYIVPNGISSEGYTPNYNKDIRSPNIGFIGNMSYLPNVEAVEWLYEQVFLPLRARIQDLSLYIIGRNPVDSVVKLGKQTGVVVTGSVDHIWSYVNAIDVFVFPLWRGAGLKNKVLEVMYAKRAIVTTSIGNEGIEAVSGRELLIADGTSDFQEKTLQLLRSPALRASLGESGHRLVSERFSWKPLLSKFEEVILD